MTDDDRLAELFRAAASDPAAPPPGFEHADVVSASRRITARRRSAVIGGSLALFAVLGVGAAVALPGKDDAATTVAAPAAVPEPAGSGGSGGSGGVEADRADRAGPVPEAAVAPGGQAGAPERNGALPEGAAGDAAAQAAPPFAGPPLGPGTATCADRQDRELRAYLEQVLPEAVGAPAAVSTDDCRPGAERYVTVELADGTRHGLFGVSYLPPGTVADPLDGAVSAPTASGGTVIVRATPVDGGAPAPFVDRVPGVAAFLAPRL
jgi:hypothetical protein